MLALIDDDGCFGVWSFSVGGLSGLLSFFPCFLPLSCLCFKSLWLLSLCWSVRECWLIVLDLLSYVKDRLCLWLYVLCIQVPETSVSLVLVVGLCHFWLLFTGHVRHLLLELILIFDFTVQLSLMDLEEEAVIGTWRKVRRREVHWRLKPSVESFWWQEKVSSWVGLALAHELFGIIIFLSDWENRERD